MEMRISSADKDTVLRYLSDRRREVVNYISSFGLNYLVSEAHVRDVLLSYPMRGGKTLRPAFVALAASAASGKDESERTLPLQAAVELYHNWTLIHDDIIDEDDFRRGAPSLHREIEELAKKDGISGDVEKYGKDIAMLVGDLMHGFVNLLILRLVDRGVSKETVIGILRLMYAELTPALLDGEARDVRFARESVGAVSEEQVLEMLEGKTAALFEFCGTAGAMVGLDTDNPAHPRVKSLAGFSRAAGLAFQIQDDILGIVGDQEKLGKPRGSDLREGKHTLLLLHALRHGNDEQVGILKNLLGKKDISEEEVNEAERILRDIGSLEYVGNVAREYMEEGLPYLEELPPSEARDMLAGIAKFMIQREF